MIGFNRGRVKVWVSRDLSRLEPDSNGLPGSREELEERQAISILKLVEGKIPEEVKFGEYNRMINRLERPLRLLRVAEQLQDYVAQPRF
jgi:hypothetical protein